MTRGDTQITYLTLAPVLRPQTDQSESFTTPAFRALQLQSTTQASVSPSLALEHSCMLH